MQEATGISTSGRQICGIALCKCSQPDFLKVVTPNIYSLQSALRELSSKNMVKSPRNPRILKTRSSLRKSTGIGGSGVPILAVV